MTPRPDDTMTPRATQKTPPGEEPEPRPALMVLEDGRTFTAKSVGADTEVIAEVVFNTSMTGYQEILTDPSYAGQLVVLTPAHVGNYGINAEDVEARRPHAVGLCARSICRVPSNHRATESLPHYLARHGLLGIYDLDTRALVRHLRDHGSLMGIVSTRDLDPESLKSKLQGVPGMAGKDLVPQVTCEAPFGYVGPLPDAALPEAAADAADRPVRVVVLDCGVKRKILGWLRRLGAQVEVVPSTTSAADVLALEPDGVLISNGPGDPAAVTYVIETIRELLGQVPMFGVCLGHQMMSLALGARTYKLKFGHRGGNQPVKNLRTGRVSVAAHNHGFAVDLASLEGTGAEPWFTHLNDNTNSGVRCDERMARSIQFHPEAAPGPNDTCYLFADWIDELRAGRPAPEPASAPTS
ncbi:MAG: glutamine-hydrolyzing carbamoyl-phosphate synthase small subunit [Planctomycetota bacterium]